MEAIHNLSRGSIDKDDGELDDLVQIGPRVLFARALEVENAYYFWDGALRWWWGWRRSRSLALLASLAASGLDARQSGAFWGQRYRRRGEEGEAHSFLAVSLYLLRVRFNCTSPCLRAVAAYKLITCCLSCCSLESCALQCLLFEPSRASRAHSSVAEQLYTTNNLTTPSPSVQQRRTALLQSAAKIRAC